MAPAAMQQAMGHQSSAGIADQDCGLLRIRNTQAPLSIHA
jgi:hypothetical protein